MAAYRKDPHPWRTEVPGQPGAQHAKERAVEVRQCELLGLIPSRGWVGGMCRIQGQRSRTKADLRRTWWDKENYMRSFIFFLPGTSMDPRVKRARLSLRQAGPEAEGHREGSQAAPAVGHQDQHCQAVAHPRSTHKSGRFKVSPVNPGARIAWETHSMGR